MIVPIRNMPEAVEAVRTAQIERGISYESIEEIAGMASGSVSKYLAWEPSRNFGVMSLFEIPAALGKAWALVDDPEQIAKVKGRWAKRKGSGGASIQLRRRASIRASITSETQDVPDLSAKEALRHHMKRIGKLGASKGGKRRAKVMGKRARQRQATHAARKRWSKRA